MPSRLVSTAAALLLAAAPLPAQQAPAPAPAPAPACAGGPLALVLPGGGVRGMAHVGVIQVLDSLGVVPDLVVGTSMGAIVGALYASGYSGRDIERLTRRYDIGAHVGRYAPRAPRALGPQPPLLLWEEGESGALDLETAAAQEGHINALLAALMLRGNLAAAGDFDRLPTPFRAVATDLATGGRVALATGDLAEAVRASFAIPLVFDPVVLGGRTLVDGGIAENVPVALAREQGAARVLLSGLSLTTVQGVPRTPEMASRMVDLLFDQTYPALGPDDVGITSQVDEAANLDFRDSTVRAMIARGRASAIAQLGALPPSSLACLTSGARGRLRPASPPPLARPLLAATTSEGPGGREARHFVQKTLGARADGTLSFDTLQARLARLGEVEAIRAAWLHPVRVAGDTVALAPVVQLAPRRAVGAGLAYDNDVGGRAWAGVMDRRLGGRPLEGALRGTAGQWEQEVAVELRKGVEDVRDARSPFVLLGWHREDVRLFDDRGVELPRNDLPRVQDRTATVGVDLPRGERAEVRATAFVRHWNPDRAEVVLPAADVVQRATTAGVGVRVRAGDGTRNLLRVEGEWTPRYARGVVEASRAAGGRWQAAGVVRLGAVGRQAPLTLWMPLGGNDGFAGLRIGERLGRAEAFASVDASRALLGPVRLHLTVMAGQVTTDAGHPLDGDWMAGARLGLGAETPIGPMRVQYGVNGDRRTQWYLRAGRWF